MSAPVHFLHSVEFRPDADNDLLKQYDPYAAALLAAGMPASEAGELQPTTIQAGTGLLFLRRIAQADMVLIDGSEKLLPREIYAGTWAIGRHITMLHPDEGPHLEALDPESLEVTDPVVQLQLGASAASEILVVQQSLATFAWDYQFHPRSLFTT